MDKLSTLLKQYIVSFKDNYPEIALLYKDMKEHNPGFLEIIDLDYWAIHGNMLDTSIGDASKDISILDLGTQFGFMPHFLKSIGFTDVECTNSFKEASTRLPDLKLCWDNLLESPPINLHIKPQEHFILPKKYDVILCSHSNILWKSDKVLKFSKEIGLLIQEAFSFNNNGTMDTFFSPYDVDDIKYLVQNLRHYLNTNGKAVIQPFPFPYFVNSFEKELKLINKYSEANPIASEYNTNAVKNKDFLQYFIITNY